MNTLKDLDQNIEQAPSPISDSCETSNSTSESVENDLWKKPSLPSWLLDVDKELDKFKKNYSDYKKEYDILNNKLNVFTEKQKQNKRDYLMNKYFKHDLEAKKEAGKCHFYDLSKYMLLEIAKFIHKDYAPALFKLSRVNTVLYEKLKDSNLWMMVVQDYFGRSFVEANEKNVAKFEAEENKVAERLAKKTVQNSKTIAYKPVVPKYPYMKNLNQSPTKQENKKLVVKKGYSYWEAVFKNLHEKLRLTRETFHTLYESKFPKNNDFSLLNKDINKSMCFIIEMFCTVGTFEYNEKLRILDLIKGLVMDQKSLLALIRLCNNDNGVIQINSITLILILLGYFKDLKKNFLQFSSLTLIQRIEAIDKEFNVTMFAINISDFELCIIPDIAGFRIFIKEIVSKLGCKSQINFLNSFPPSFPMENVLWKGAYLTPKGQILQEFYAMINFNEETGRIEGHLEYYKKDDEDEYERKVIERIKGSYSVKAVNNKVNCMKTPHPMKSFREVIGKIEVAGEDIMEDEYELGLDIALSIKKEGWFACLHGCSIMSKVFFCYQKMNEE